MSSFFQRNPAPPYQENYGLNLQKRHGLIFLCMTRDTNKNVIVYELNVRNGILNRKTPVLIYWLDIDPKYRRKRRTPIDYCPLSMRERMLYGCSMTKIGQRQWKFESGALDKKMCGIVTWDGKNMARLQVKDKPIHTGHVHLNNNYSIIFNPFKYVRYIELKYGENPTKSIRIRL